MHDVATVEHIKVNGKKLTTYQWGNGDRPVLVLHGFGGRASNMASFVVAFQKCGLTAVSFDSLGHGDSEGKRATILDQELAVRAVADNSARFTR